MWIVVALFALLTAILLSGKGSFLIAGYNTASKIKKAEYNEKKLSRVMGGGTGIITILLAIRAVVQNNTPAFFNWLMPVITVITVVITLILSHTICKKKYLQPVEQAADEQIQTPNMTKYTRFFVVVVVCIVGFFLVTGDVTVRLDTNMLDIKGSYWPDQSIHYEDIQSVTYMEDLTIGFRTNGLGSFKLQEGHFKNDQFGNYILYSYIKCKSYIVIRTTSDIFVINGKSKGETETLYEDLLERLEG